MGIDIFWWFCKVEEANFLSVKSEFDPAVAGVPELPEVPPLSPRPKAPPVTEDYCNSVLEGVFAGQELSLRLYHEPFNSIGYRLVQQDFPLCHESIIEVVIQSRVAPTAVLLMGIGSERFSQLPGYLGNMLIHSSKIEQTLNSVVSILDVEWEAYFERARLVLDYGGSYEREVKDVSEALQALPKALKIVKEEGAGLLAVTSWGHP